MEAEASAQPRATAGTFMKASSREEESMSRGVIMESAGGYLLEDDIHQGMTNVQAETRKKNREVTKLLPQPRLPGARGSRLRPSLPSRPNPRLEGGSPSNSRGIGIPQNNNKNGTSVRTGSSFKLRGFLLELYLGVCLGVCARFIRLVSVTSTRPVHVPSFVFPCTSITSL